MECIELSLIMLFLFFCVILVILLVYSNAETIIAEVQWNLQNLLQLNQTFQSFLNINFSSKFSIQHPLRDNNIISINLNLTLAEYFFGRRIILPDLLPFHESGTSELLTSLCPLDHCPYCKGTGILICSTSSTKINPTICRNTTISPIPSSSTDIVESSDQAYEIAFDYSVPCPYCQGFGKIDESRNKVLQYYDQGLFRQYSSFSSASLDYFQFLSSETFNNQTKYCTQYMFEMKEKLYKPYFLDLPAFIHPLYPAQSLIYHLPVTIPFLSEEQRDNENARTIEIKIEDIEATNLYQSSDLSLYFKRNSTHFLLWLDVFLTAEEVFQGFFKSVPLFPFNPTIPCQEFTINRTNQFTMPNSTVSIPFPMLFNHLCSPYEKSTEEKENDEIYSIPSINHDSLYPSRHVSQQLQIHFQLYPETLFLQQLKEKWYCKDEIAHEDQRIARLQNLQYVHHQFIHQNAIQDLYCITILNESEDFFPTIDPTTGQEIIHPREYYLNYQYERLNEIKLRNWISFLSKI